jgi:biopolymer transport protein ExbD
MVAFTQLEGELAQIKKNIADVTIILRTDNSLTVQDLVEDLEIGNKLQIKMILATQKKSG